MMSKIRPEISFGRNSLVSLGHGASHTKCWRALALGRSQYTQLKRTQDRDHSSRLSGMVQAEMGLDIQSS